jgi:hypothetical protein
MFKEKSNVRLTPCIRYPLNKALWRRENARGIENAEYYFVCFGSTQGLHV